MLTDDEKRTILEAALDTVELSWDDYGQDGYVTGTRMASDIATDLLPALQEAGYDIVRKDSKP